MYRRPKFLEILIEIRQEMSREVDYDVDLFAEMIRSEQGTRHKAKGKNDNILQVQIEEHKPDELKILDIGFGIDITKI